MSIASASYRAALRLYPRRFRRAYGDDMAALFDAQLRDERALRVVGRSLVDLLVTVPIRHLEAHMSHTSTTVVVVALVASAAVLAVVGGAVGAVAAVMAVVAAGMTWSRQRPVLHAGTGRWWKLLSGGAGLLASLVVVTSATGELSSGGWLLAMAAGLTSVVLIATGVVLGAASRFHVS